MNEKERKELRALVRTMYDYQDMRLRTAGRLRLNADGEIVNTDFMDDAEISEHDYTTLEFVRKTTNKIEKILSKEIKGIVTRHPLWGFFEHVRGCGHLMSAAVMCEIDIHKADTVSKIWQYSGLNPGQVRGKKIIKVTKNTDKSQLIKEYENQKGEKCGIVLTDEMVRGDKRTPGYVAPFNGWLRTKLIGVLAPGMIKAQNGETGKNYALEFYYPYKARLEQEENEVMHLGKMTPWKDVSKGHRDMAARRYMIKMFLKDLYVVWRTLENLPIREPYAEEYLGKKHSA